MALLHDRSLHHHPRNNRYRPADSPLGRLETYFLPSEGIGQPQVDHQIRQSKGVDKIVSLRDLVRNNYQNHVLRNMPFR